MASTPTIALVDALRQYRLLQPAHLEEVTGSLQARFPSPKALAGELIRRGWLTPYQANELLQGRGQELLLGSYVLLERLGEGGMGQVFMAKNWKLGRTVALKLIKQERLDNPNAVRRFQREVRAVAALSHPNIVLAYDADEIDGTHLLVMEYVEGATDLHRLVQQTGPLPVPQACEYVRQAALGLQHAYERGLVHRDIKPANLLLTAGGQVVKVLDLGLARLDQSAVDGEASSTMTQEGLVLGTPDYIAPEQALGAHTVDIRADLYSLGCTLYYLLTGRVPFPGGSLLQKLNKHQNEPAPAVETLRPDVPSAVAGVVGKLMAKRPEDRYQTPAELAGALASVVSPGQEPSQAGSGADRTVAERPSALAETSGDTLNSALAYMAHGGATEAVESPRRLRRKAAERRWLLVSVAGGSLVLVGLVVLGFLLVKQPAGPKPPESQAQRPAVATARSEWLPQKVDDAWLKHVAALSAEEQVKAVAAKLKDLNAGFDGKVQPTVEGGVVTQLRFLTDNVTDLAPVRALAELQSLTCTGSGEGQGKLADLSPLTGMKLTGLSCYATKVSDLSPLQGMPLTSFDCRNTPVADLSSLKGMQLTGLACHGTKVADLSPLKGMPLAVLSCYSTPVSDLSPLRGMRLMVLDCHGTKVADLSPLRGMELQTLYCQATPVSDLSPLKGMPLILLFCHNTKVADLSPLHEMPLKELRCDFKAKRDGELLRSIRTLETINGKPAKEFWKEVDEKKLEKR